MTRVVTKGELRDIPAPIRLPAQNRCLNWKAHERGSWCRKTFCRYGWRGRAVRGFESNEFLILIFMRTPHLSQHP